MITPTKICPKCQTHHKKSGNFCSRSCANSRKWSDEDKKKKSISAKNSTKVKPYDRPKGSKVVCSVSFCCFCGKTIPNSKRKTCSDECRSNHMSSIFKEHRRKSNRKFTESIWYDSPIAGTVYLESSWEIKLAKSLDKNNIRWIRPKYLKYTLDNKRRMYYPDFYLKDYDIYLDPKNPYQTEIDKPKLFSVVSEHNINLLIISSEEYLEWDSLKEIILHKECHENGCHFI